MKTVGDAYFDRDIGQQLKECRVGAGWSQAQVASLLGVTFQQIQKYETGTNRLPANRYPKLADALGFYPVSLLFFGDDQRRSSGIGDQLSHLFRLFISMPADKRNQLLSVAQRLETDRSGEMQGD